MYSMRHQHFFRLLVYFHGRARWMAWRHVSAVRVERAQHARIGIVTDPDRRAVERLLPQQARDPEKCAAE